MAALDRAITLVEVNTPALTIAQHLDLDVAGALQQSLDVESAVAEGGLGLGPRHREEVLELVGRAGDAHALAAAAGGRLDHDREANLLGRFACRARIVYRIFSPGDHRDPGFGHRPARGDLVAHLPDLRGGRPDEHEVGGLADLCELGVLGEEPVAGVNRIGASDLSRRGRPDADVLVRETHVQRLAIGLGMHGYGRDAELAAGTYDAERDFPAISDQDFLKQGCLLSRA